MAKPVKAENDGTLTLTVNKAAAPMSQALEEKKSEKNSIWYNFFLLEILNKSQADNFDRSAAAQREIDAAQEAFKDEIASLDTMDRAQRDQYLSEHPEIAGAIYNNGYDGGGTQSFRDIGRISVGETQKAVMDVMADAFAASGVNIKTMRGVWYNETTFSKGGQVSSTGCSGPFQFSRGTWAETILKHGDEIAQRLQARGFLQDAEKVYEQHLALRQQRIRPSDANLQAMRFEGRVATYAAAYYLSDIAKRNGIDARNENNGGLLYAGYNIGEGNLRKLMSGQDVSGSYEARVNFGAGTSLASYQAKVANGNHQYANAFGRELAFVRTASVNPAVPSHHKTVLAAAFNESHKGIVPLSRNNNHAPTLLDQASQVASTAIQSAWSWAAPKLGLG